MWPYLLFAVAESLPLPLSLTLGKALSLLHAECWSAGSVALRRVSLNRRRERGALRRVFPHGT